MGLSAGLEDDAMADTSIETVFLSSTAKDLAPYREAVYGELNESRFFKCFHGADRGGPDLACMPDQA